MQNVNGTALIQSPVEKTKEYEKKQAAYALNLCMVSISQIIDYNDINILEQEYEAILNNLNLEHMPKDEELLDILRQMLDTITFFRIQEVEKTFIEKEYQQKLKSAVLQGVSQISMAGAGIATFVKNPAQGALAIASTVGSAYINYRKNREEYASNRERQLWQLQRAAIEQFNGLKRELFATAWRLAAKYDFPDEYRLTERQIKQYNEILLDKDAIRRYERLSAVSKNFKAYPPFWYYFGNTANEISRIEKFEENIQSQYKMKAREYYEKYLENEEMNLLREDQMISFCALEYIDILDRKEDAEKIDSLLDIASKYAGNSNDILQLCAIAHIKINKKEKAAELLRYLINEDYNRIINAQFLSAIYADLYKSYTDEDKKQDIKGKYQILGMRVDAKYLYEFSTDNKSEEDVEREFLERQKWILKRKYTLVLRQFVKKYRIMYNQVIPVPDERKDYPESYFAEDTTEACEIRIKEVKNIFERGGRVREEYLLRLEEANVELSYLNVLNQMFRAVLKLNVISAEIEEDLKGCIEKQLSDNKDKFEDSHKKLVNREFEFNDYVKLRNIKLGNLTGNFFNKLQVLLREMINSIDDESEIADFENNLAVFCLSEGFHAPEILYENKDELQIKDEEDKDIFSADILGVGAVKDAEIHEKAKEMRPIIKESLQSISITCDRSKVGCYTEYYDLSKYFSKRAMEKNRYILKKALAIIDDRTWSDFDLVLTVNGIIPIIKNKGKECVEYSKVEKKDNALEIGEFSYKNQAIDLNQLLKLFTKLKEYQPQNEEKKPFALGGEM